MRFRFVRLLLYLSLTFFSLSLWAAKDVYVMALFKDKAMVSINGKNRLLVKGKPSPEGVELLSADHKQALLRIDGKERVMKLGTRIAATYSKPQRREVRIIRNSEDSYTTSGTINGRSVEFLVDTGATTMAMSNKKADSLGIDYEKTDQKKKVQVITAGGAAEGVLVVLKSVRVGEIEVRNVKATIIMDSGPETTEILGSDPEEEVVLLGMTFLKGLELVNEGNLMLLRAPY